MVDTKPVTPGMCPSSESLAAYLDGALATAERVAIESHLAGCDDCRDIASESSLTFEDVDVPPQPVADDSKVVDLRPARRRWRWPVATILTAAAAITVAFVVPTLIPATDPSARPELAALVAAVGKSRPFEPRLTGGFNYGPLSPVMRSGEGPFPQGSPTVRIAASALEKAHSERATPETAAARATAELVLGRVDEAIALLDQATRGASSVAAYWSDLSAAQLVRSDRIGDPAAAQKGLAAANTALSLVPALAEARFNRALALERLGRRDEAKRAWAQLATEGASDDWGRAASAYALAGNPR